MTTESISGPRTKFFTRATDLALNEIEKHGCDALILLPATAQTTASRPSYKNTATFLEALKSAGRYPKLVIIMATGAHLAALKNAAPIDSVVSYDHDFAKRHPDKFSQFIKDHL